MSEFDANRMISALEVGYANGDFERGEIDDALEYAFPLLTDEEIAETQRVSQQRFSILAGVHDALVTEKVHRLRVSAKLGDPEQ